MEEFPLHPDFTGKEVSLVLHMEGKAPFIMPIWRW